MGGPIQQPAVAERKRVVRVSIHDGLRYRARPRHCQPVTPESIDSLRAPLTSLPGIGPRLAALLARAVGGDTLRDLLFHLPEHFIDRRERFLLRDAKPGSIGTFTVEVVGHEAPSRKSQPHRVVIRDSSGFGEVVLFHPGRLVQFPVGAKLLISGKVERYADRITLPHPDYVVPVMQEAALPMIEPVWRLTAGLYPRVVARAMAAALARLPDLPEWQNPSVLRQRHWPGFGDALRALHAPAAIPDDKPARRLAYDELLARQIAFALIRRRSRKRPGRAFTGKGHLRAAALARFGFPPTNAQAAALAEIDADLAAPHRMLRLLQGDVGSGKTLVAALAMLRVVEAGAQAALLAPTELLARQHHATLSKLCPVPVALLTGSLKTAERRKILAGLADGAIPIIIGTHSIFQKSVEFHDLGLAVIDEQHRFGVEQRFALGAKGEATDMLVMTATPIPRTLLLSHWGEMTVSRIAEKPAGRTPIRTTLHPLDKMADITDAIARMIARGGRVYWVCPLVSESEMLDIAAAELRFAALAERFSTRVALAHGRQPIDIRAAALAGFASGKTDILVSTTVIEVGVDVPEANVMVIEHAERFGLAQLHQLRGRVGRGAAASYCLLLQDADLTRTARKRLAILRETEDGFRIADEDFRLRGGGDVLGARQSGLPGYRLADAERDSDLISMAHKDAAMLLDSDPTLTTPRGQAARTLLRLFDQARAIRALAAG
ncbi:ATP-dependent DNA helicase RecG [Acidiphilium iwatense]|uniref:ATP-dependent DNA helicase RecG n=1 Tax=Acidiphilium iwatense TaxID=768198 RepID=A0ABS9DS93_9PROT|nr:ATP-dependent DNA helicase RecG [Acidiphilium iwatense]MCF3945600.1 ATP-dependent DNA helicase RecG [Acidiphilium iwatense]